MLRKNALFGVALLLSSLASAEQPKPEKPCKEKPPPIHECQFTPVDKKKDKDASQEKQDPPRPVTLFWKTQYLDLAEGDSAAQTQLVSSLQDQVWQLLDISATENVEKKVRSHSQTTVVESPPAKKKPGVKKFFYKNAGGTRTESILFEQSRVLKTPCAPPVNSRRTLECSMTVTNVEVPEPARLKQKQERLAVSRFGDGLMFRAAKQPDLDKAAWQMATQIDVPQAQVQLDFWALQINSRVQDFEGTQDRLHTIELGMGLTRELSREFQALILDRISNKLKTLPELQKAAIGKRYRTLFDQIRCFGTGERRLLWAELEDQGYQNFWVNLLDARIAQIQNQLNSDALDLPCKERETLEQLQKLLRAFRQRAQSGYFLRRTRDFYLADDSKPDQNEWIAKDEQGSIKGEASPGQQSVGRFLYLSDQVPRTVDNALRLRRSMDRVDMDLRDSIQAVSADISFLLSEPFQDWVGEIASETNQLNVVGHHRIWAEAGKQAVTEVKATNYRKFETLVPGTEGQPATVPNDRDVAVGLVVSAVNSTDIKDIFGNEKFQDALFREPKFEYSAVSPGLNLTVTPKSAGGTQTDLDFKLDFSADTIPSPEHEADVEKGLRPLSLVKTTSLDTRVAVPSFEIFELSTQWMQTTRGGEPSWACPVLRHIPLIGRYLFEGPVRPKTINQGVLIFCQATVIPRALDLIPVRKY